MDLFLHLGPGVQMFFAFMVLFVLVNVVTFLLYVVDKWKAVNGKWRIKEATLLWATLVLGGVGASLGMVIARHKTNKLKFKAAMVAGLLVAAAAVTLMAYILLF